MVVADDGRVVALPITSHTVAGNTITLDLGVANTVHRCVRRVVAVIRDLGTN